MLHSRREYDTIRAWEPLDGFIAQGHREPLSHRTCARASSLGEAAFGVEGIIQVTESDIERGILDYFALRGIFAWRTHNARYLPVQVGISDIVGVLPGGRILAIEVKTSKGYLSGAQGDFLARVNQHGGLAFSARSIEEVIAEVDKVLQPKGKKRIL